MLTPELKEQLESTLARLRPAAVRVIITGQDEPKRFKPIGTKGRWRRLVDAIPPNVERIEFLGPKDDVIDAVDIVEEPDELAELSGEKGVTGAVAKIVQIITRAQSSIIDKFSSRETADHKELLELVQTMMMRLREQEELLASLIKIVYDSMSVAARAQGTMDENPRLTRMMEIAVSRAFGPSKKPAPTGAKPNGTPPKTGG